MVHSLKIHIIKYLLLTMILAFFAIPISMLCFYDCRFLIPQKAGSILLFFFR